MTNVSVLRSIKPSLKSLFKLKKKKHMNRKQSKHAHMAIWGTSEC